MCAAAEAEIERPKQRGLRKRDTLNFRATQQVLTHWKAIVKALELKNRNVQDPDHLLAGLKDAYFREVREIPILTEQVNEDEATEITDIYLLRSKKYLLATGLDYSKSLTTQLKGISNERDDYTNKLEGVLKDLNREIDSLESAAILQETDLTAEAWRYTGQEAIRPPPVVTVTREAVEPRAAEEEERIQRVQRLREEKEAEVKKVVRTKKKEASPASPVVASPSPSPATEDDWKLAREQFETHESMKPAEFLAPVKVKKQKRRRASAPAEAEAAISDALQ